MLLILPPSETKREGGDAERPLDLAALSHPALTRPRRTALAQLRTLSTNLATAAVALKLGPASAPEAERNRHVRTGPTMAALDRFDGVLFDALDTGSLSESARAFASQHLRIHSALFGLVGAADPIPAYRLSADSRLPGTTLRAIWRDAVAAELDAHDGLILDLRSEGYVALGPAPRHPRSVYLRVLAEDGDGRRRALNHFNKAAKGRFTRALMEAGVVHRSVEGLLEWAREAGIPVSRGAEGELDLLA